MFRLDVSHFQAPTLTLPDALSTLGSHSVYMWITYLLELLEKLGNCPVYCLTQVAAQRSQHGEQKQCQTTSTPKRRYSHSQGGTRPTTRDEKQRNKEIHILTKKPAGKLHPTSLHKHFKV